MVRDYSYINSHSSVLIFTGVYLVYLPLTHPNSTLPPALPPPHRSSPLRANLPLPLPRRRMDILQLLPYSPLPLHQPPPPPLYAPPPPLPLPPSRLLRHSGPASSHVNPTAQRTSNCCLHSLSGSACLRWRPGPPRCPLPPLRHPR